jgi:transcriptional regulator with XRE-family HTH domain
MSRALNRPETFGKNIQRIRYLAGRLLGKTDAQGELKELTQAEFGLLIGSLMNPVKQSTITGWEKRKRVPDGATIARIVEICDVDEDTLMYGEVKELGRKNRLWELALERKLPLPTEKRISSGRAEK